MLAKKLSSLDNGATKACDRDLVIATPIKITLMTIRQGKRQSIVDFSPRKGYSSTSPCHLFVLQLIKRDLLEVKGLVACKSG
jgi:hypothetical protein